MKKIILFIFGLLVFIPNMIFADMGAPGIDPYKATVSNKNGAPIYEYECDEKTDECSYKATTKTIKYGKTVIIISEEGEYGEASLSEDEACTIKLSDITIIQKNYTMKESEWQKKETAIVLKKGELRKGPARGYGTTGVTLEPGTKVTARVNKNTSGNSWAYIEYNGSKGYFDTYEGSLAYGKTEGVVIAFTDTKILDSATGEAKGTLKVNSVIKGTYYNLDPWSRAYYFDRTEINGVISSQDVATDSEGTVVGTLKRDVKLYNNVDMYYSTGSPEYEKNMQVITTLKKGTVVKTNITNGFNWADVYYYQDGNTKGWIYDLNNEPEYDDDGNPIYTKDESLYGYALETPEGENKEKVVINVEENIMTDLPKDNTAVVPAQPNETQDIVAEEETRTIPYEKLFMGVVIALILCIAALVTVILINRKKNKIDY